MDRIDDAIDELLKSESLSELLRKAAQLDEERRQWKAEHYPDDPPNSKCGHALIEGVKLYNTAGLSVGDLKHLFDFGHEICYVWTHTSNDYSSLLVEVDDRVHEANIWKTLGHCLQLASGFRTSFETQARTHYKWIYRFDRDKSRQDQDFKTEYFPSDGHIWTLRYILELAPLLELLLRDETFLVATSNLCCSVDNHALCIICALHTEGYQMHPNHEPEKWERVGMLSSMEAAIVQATRSVEAILGKPGKRDTERKLARAKTRWREAVDLDPDDPFETAGVSYLDYYYALFGTRGDAAHSLGELPYELSRRLTVEAQSFAWLVLFRYYRRHSLGEMDAAQALDMNTELILSEPEGVSTTMTADNERFAHIVQTSRDGAA